MDRTEKLEFQQKIEVYFEERRVYDLFEKLLKELVITKPKDPIDYLISRIKKKDCKRIFITGTPGTNRKNIALYVSDILQIACICVRDLLQNEIKKKLEIGKLIEKKFKAGQLVDDEIVIELVKKEMIKYEKDNVSYIVEGFPKNRIQGMFLQSVGLIPDNMIFISSTRELSEESIKERVKNEKLSQNELLALIKESADQSDLNLSALKDIYKGFYSEIKKETKEKKEQEVIIEDIAKIIRLKSKTTASRKPPRILLLGPPCSRKYEIAEIVARKHGITHVSISDLLLKEIGNKNDNSQSILASMNNGELVNDKFILKLLEDRLYASDCMINGWILTGFPKNNSQIHYLKSTKAFNPSKVINIYLDDEVTSKRSLMRKLDPISGRFYFVNKENEGSLSKEILNRLMIKNEDRPEIFQKRLTIWKKISPELETVFQPKLERISEMNIETIVEKISDVMRNDS